MDRGLLEQACLYVVSSVERRRAIALSTVCSLFFSQNLHDRNAHQSPKIVLSVTMVDVANEVAKGLGISAPEVIQGEELRDRGFGGLWGYVQGSGRGSVC